MAKKLGQGLNKIFGENLDSLLDDIQNGNNPNYQNKTEIKISEIRRNPYQPRIIFDEDALKELSESIKIHGVFTPILVRKSVTGYELVSGERRLKASKLAGKETIPAIIVDFDDKAMMEISLLENIQRENLNSLEEAKGFESLIKNLNYTQEQLAQRVGKSRVYITNTLRLLKLPNEVQELLMDNKLTAGHARALITLEDEAKAIELAKLTAKNKLSVRELEKMVAQAKGFTLIKKPKPIDPNLKNVSNIMEKKLGTKVELSKNKIVINYNGNDDLNRILEILDCLEK